ncbi:MAG: tRNA uridine-5-carboxymethylaminomethyl(34) synthesis GTPase MnmE [Candidatus Cloacimonetes bacterium]|nr:tRNA uridine-5-carboxymethylaminomethyl(34) synthesis GTPase MnmE [Candidatus Cloacimonadota bacterium]
MIYSADPICALITPAGHSAIAVIRISGNGVIDLVAQHFSNAKKLLKSPSHRLLHGVFGDSPQHQIDEVLVSLFRNPNSYTGEDCIEISCHGNPNIAKRILQSLLKHSRMAKPGEFTLRAYLNGKLDLSQAEAVNDLINASVSKAENAALMQLRGILSKHLQEILQRITEARLRCELAIDFADQDLPSIDLADLRLRILNLFTDAKDLANKGEQGRKIREGIKICLAGAPNTGKSSLFNAFLQQNRAIVTPHPGTTRDYLEESISLAGFPVVIVDTAGLRDSEDEIENQGIAKSYELMQEADIVLYLIDSTNPVLPASANFPMEYLDRSIIVYSKADLLPEDYVRHAEGIYCSVLQPSGLVALSKAILTRLNLSDTLLENPLVTNVRHLAALAGCIESLQNALLSLDNGSGFEFVAFELASASGFLEEILGVITPDHLLENIFSNFCIGK